MIQKARLLPRAGSLILCFVMALGLHVSNGYGQITIAADDASDGVYDSDGWGSGDNGGSGFGGWTLSTDTPNGGFAGFFIGSFSTALDVSNESFVVYANGGNDAKSEAVRPFPARLSNGDSFTVKVGVNFRDGAKGFNIRNDSGGDIINFNVASDRYTLAGTDLFSNSYDANTVFTFTFTQNATDVSYTVARSGGQTASTSGTISSINEGTLVDIEFYNVSAGTNNDGGSGQRNLFINSLQYTANSDYAVESSSTVTLTENKSVPYYYIKSDAEIDIDTYTLTISDGGVLVNDGGTFTAGTGKVAFAGAATVIGTVSFNNVDISGGVNFGSSSTVNGELKLLAGGSVTTNKPTYGSSSTLTYNTGGDYGTSTEWSTGADGAPQNVKIVDSSVNFGSSELARYVLDGLTIESEGTLALSTASGGDLRIRGNWNNSGTFTANGRAVFFDGSSPQTITNTTDTAISIPYTFIQNDVTANSNMTVETELDITADKTFTILSGNALITPSGGVNYNTSGKIEFQRELTSPNYGSLPEGETGHWVGLSSPIYSATFAGSGGFLEEIWTQGFTGADDTNGDPNIIVFDPSVQDFVAPSSNTITSGQGFAAYLYKNKTRGVDTTAVDYNTPFAVSGSENTFSSDSHTFTLSTNGNGWNFLGNPFGASLDWTSDDWNKANIGGGGFIYIWNPADGTYKISVGGDSIDDAYTQINGVLTDENSKIAPFQAFWVQATGTTLTMDATARTITSPNAGLFIEDDNSGENTISSTPVLSLTLELEDEMSSITAFRFGESYSTLFTENDAYYLSPFGRSFAYLFSYMDNTPALLKSLPVQSEEPIVVPLSVGGYSNLNYYSGEATLTRSQFDNIPASWDVKLIDSHTNTEIDLQTMESYSFTLTPSNKSTGALSMFDLMAEGSPVINTALTNPNKAVTRFSLLINNAVPTSIDPADELPVSVALAQNYPNPFNPATSIRFELPEAQSVMLEVFDMSGRQIATLASGVHQAGSHEVKFDASDLSSGVYLYRLQTAAGTLTHKFTLLK